MTSRRLTARVVRGSAAANIDLDTLLSARPPASIAGSPGWVRSAHEHLHGDGAARAVLVERAGALVGRLCLAVDPGDHGTIARVAGYPMNDLTDVLSRAGDEPVVGAAVLHALQALAADGTTIDLTDLDPEGTLVAAARRATPSAISEGDPAPTLDLCGAAPLGSSARRKEWRRQLRRLNDEHTVEVVWQRSTALAALGDLLALRAARFAAAGRLHELPAIEKGPAFKRFLIAAVDRLAPHGSCAIASLLVDGSAIARDLYLLDDDVAMLFLRGIDPRYAGRGPGHLLLQASMVGLCAKGFRILDLGRGDEPYKEALGGRPRTLARLTLAACGSSTS